jgi:stage II sporulation protein D
MRFVLILIFVALFSSLWGQSVSISLFNDQSLRSIVVSQMLGKYSLIADSSKLLELTNDDAIYISMYGEKLAVRNSRGPIGFFNSVKFVSRDSVGMFRLAAVNPKGDVRQYNNNLSLSVAFYRILAINEVEVDKYLSGVVEAETGPNASLELYKAQAVLARTFLYGNIHKHNTEGFDLCDGEHCQAYKGCPMRNAIIYSATRATFGVVVLGPDSSYITSSFHANCGGETESAGVAWLNPKSYLVSVKDPFCQNSPMAQWSKTIPTEQWVTYLQNHGFKVSLKTPVIQFDFSQINRRQYYRIGKDSIPTKQIRSDFKLRSTFFSVIGGQKEILIKGKGYGHGVGMCQEGAIQMAKIGYKYDEILNYYFKGILLARVPK